MFAKRSHVFALAVRRPDQPAEIVPLDRFPFTIGRAADNAVRLDAAGVWDRHLTLRLDSSRGLLVEPAGGALARVGEEILEGPRRLRHAEEIAVGPARIQILLAPPRRRSLRTWDVLLWSILGILAAVQFIIAQVAFMDPR